jgi:hypothetical protein
MRTACAFLAIYSPLSEVTVVTKFTRRLWGGVVAFMFVVGCSTAPAEKPEARPAPQPPSRESARVVLSPALQLVPTDAVAFLHVRVADLWKSESCKELRHILAKAGPEALQALERKYVPAPGDIESVTLIYQTPDSLGTPLFAGAADRVSPVLVVTTAKPLDRAQLATALGPFVQLNRTQNQEYFSVAANHSAFQLVDERTLVIASEKALWMWLKRPAGASRNGPLHSALLEANGKHGVVFGVRPAALPKEPFGPFRSTTKTFTAVGNTIGSAPAPQPPAVPIPKDVAWTSIALPLLKARCLTVTLDLHSKLHGQVKLDFGDDEHAASGAGAVRAGLQKARESLAEVITGVERELRDGPRTFSSFGKPAPKTAKGPKALVRETDRATADLFSVLQIGMYRALDEQLQALALERHGNGLRLRASTPVNATTLLFTITAITALGTNANATFETVGTTIEAAPAPRVDPKPGPALASVLPPGKRAVGVRVQMDTAAARFAAVPGTRVDLIWSTLGKDEKQSFSRILVENVLVLAADKPSQGLKTAVVTLALTPEDAARVQAAAQTGHFVLAVRSPSQNQQGLRRTK